MRGAWCLVVLSWLGCAESPTAGRVGASIAVLSSGALAVVNPDHGSVSLVDAETLQPTVTRTVGTEPLALLELRDGTMAVTTHRSGQLVLLDSHSLEERTRRDLCSGPVGIAETPDFTALLIACEWSGEVLKVVRSSLEASVVVSGLRRPRALAVVGSTVFVAEHVSGKLVTVSLKTGRSTSSALTPRVAAYRPALTKMTANLAAAIVPFGGQVYVAHALENHTGDTSDEVVADDYGKVLNGTPKINPAVTAFEVTGAEPKQMAVPPTYARFDSPEHVFSGPVALAPFGGHFLLVAHISTNDVAVIDVEATNHEQRLVGTFPVGAGPSGIAVDEAKHVAYVDNAFDGSISRLDLNAPRATDAPASRPIQTTARYLGSAYSEAALAGRKLFFDATNRHATPSRVVSCATCHPWGADDGLVWFMHTPAIALKRRATPHLANAHSQTAPFHWDGEFSTMASLTHATITDLMAGDGLLIDTSTMQAYLDELVLAPVAPAASDAEAVQRGAQVFLHAKCDSCHPPSRDFTDGLMHAVLTPASLSDDDVFAQANTPSLHGLFMRGPFFHDGRAETLTDVLLRSDAKAHADGTRLSNAELNDLLAYLRSL